MIRVGLLALLGLASFAVVYVAMGPRAPETAPSPAATMDQPAQTASVDAPAAPESVPRASVPSVSFELRPSTAASTGTGTEPAPSEPPQAASAPPPQPPAPPVRDVTPDDMTAGPHVTGPLARVEPAAPQPEPAPARRGAHSAAVQSDRRRRRHHQGRGTRHPSRRHRCAGLRRALRRGRRGMAVRAHGARRAAPLHPRTRHRMRRAGGRRQCSRSGDLPLSPATISPRGWWPAAGRSTPATTTATEEDAARKAALGLWGDGRPGIRPRSRPMTE